MPPIESILGELDEKAISDMRKMMNSILDEIENMEGDESHSVALDDSGHLPQFDDEWYCP